MNDKVVNKTDKVDKDKLGETPRDYFGANFKQLTSIESYYPTRFEYMFGKALQGLVVGRADKDIAKAVRNAILLAKEAEEALDKAQD